MSIIVNGIELTEVIYAGVNLDIVKVKKGAAEAVTVFEKMTQLATPQNVSADGTTVSWDEVENATSYDVLADGASIGTVENVTQDALAGTWVFKDTLGFDDLGISQEETINFRFNFISDNSEIKELIVNSGLTQEEKTVYEVIYVVFPEGVSIGEPTSVYYSADVPDSGYIKGWALSSYKTIEVTSKLSEVTNGDKLLTWLTANGTKQASTPRVSVDLTTLPGWSALSSGTHNITIVAKADGYRDSEPSAAVQVEKAALPNKGDIITLDSKQYRVLKVNGTVAEVLCMYDANSSIKFDSASSGYNNTYAEKNIDAYCNNTFYSGLSSAMKSAIVDKTFTQDSWEWASSVPTELHYTGKYGSSTYYLTLVNAAYGSSIIRHCYCLSIQDVLDYLEATTSMGTSDTTLTDANVWQMFWNVTTSPSGKFIWLRTAKSSDSRSAFSVLSNLGRLDIYYVNIIGAARPAFQIDLSKIAWSK